jgi:hypothetical protein
MELLRIVSMLFVLILHANYLGIHAPSPTDFRMHPESTILRCIIEALTIVAVNVFVLISGWFGIKFNFNKLSSLCFQILFFSLGFFIVFSFISPSEAFTINRIKGIFLMNADYWFVKAYLILFILSPVLNAFIDHVSQKQFFITLAAFYSFHTVYGWLMDASVNFTMNGTTGLSFIGLYLLGRYLRLNPSKYSTMNKYNDLLIYIGCAVLLCASNSFLLHYGIDVSVEGRLFSYASPLVIIASVYLMLFFSKLSFQSKCINWIASSCLAVYLFHCNGFFFGKYYRQVIEQIYYHSDNPITGTLIYVFAIYTLAIFIDKVRIYCWNYISHHLFHAVSR